MSLRPTLENVPYSKGIVADEPVRETFSPGRPPLFGYRFPKLQSANSHLPYQHALLDGPPVPHCVPA